MTQAQDFALFVRRKYIALGAYALDGSFPREPIALANHGHLFVGKAHHRKVEHRIDRQQIFTRQVLATHRLIERHVADAVSAYLRYAGVGPECATNVAPKRPYIRSLGAFANQVERGEFLAGASFSLFAFANYLKFADANLAGFQLDLAAAFHQVACADAVDFHGAVLRRNLLDITRELRQYTFNIFAGNRLRFTLLDDFTVPFEGIGFVAQVQPKAVALVLGFYKGQQARATPGSGNNQARGTQVERARMAYALRRKDPFQWEKGLKRSFASDLVQKNEAGIAQLQVPFLLQFGQNAFDMHGVFQVFIQNKIQFRNLTDLKRLA